MKQPEMHSLLQYSKLVHLDERAVLFHSGINARSTLPRWIRISHAKQPPIAGGCAAHSALFSRIDLLWCG